MVTLEKVRRDAPWAWIKGAIDDMRAAPFISIGYGAVFTIIGLLITVGLWSLGQGAVVPVMMGGFALVAPASAIGIYRISQMRDQGQTPGLWDFWSIPKGRFTQLALLSVLMLVFFLTWARLAQMMFALFTHEADFRLENFLPFLFTDVQGVMLMAIGTLVGAALALLAFTVSALSFPMMVDQDVDAVTAVVASIKAVKDQPEVMLVWAWIIAFATAAGLALFGIGIIITFPLIAHASWRAYKDFNPRPKPSAKEVEARLAEENHA